MRPIPRRAIPPDRPRRSRWRGRTPPRRYRRYRRLPDCEQLVALTIPAGIGELRQLGATRRFGHLVMEVTTAGAGFADDILNQQLALIVFVIPGFDIDVFRAGVNIRKAGI